MAQNMWCIRPASRSYAGWWIDDINSRWRWYPGRMDVNEKDKFIHVDFGTASTMCDFLNARDYPEFFASPEYETKRIRKD